VSQLAKVDEVEAKKALIDSGMSVKTAVVMIHCFVDRDNANKIIDENKGMLRKIIS
jgi:N-acetylmuramic acid 6-phosphate (MurNAc-6-P) etherase